MNSLFFAANEIQSVLQNLGRPFCFIGGLAVLRWGEMRMTRDIDLCLLCGFGNEEQIVKELTEKFRSRISGPLAFGLANRILLLSSTGGVPLDVSLSGLPYEEEMISRATRFLFSPNLPLITCSAEDLIVLKSFAGRAKDWGDVESIVQKQGNKLDAKYIFENLAPLCELKESPETVKKLEEIILNHS